MKKTEKIKLYYNTITVTDINERLLIKYKERQILEDLDEQNLEMIIKKGENNELRRNV